MYESVSITTEERIFTQQFFCGLNMLTKLNIINSLNTHPTKMLLIFNATLNLPVIFDIKRAIITKIFTNFKLSITLRTVIDNVLTPFCATFDMTCNYLTKFRTHEKIVKRLIDHFIITSMNQRTNIMCISNTSTSFILHNEYSSVNFSLLIFDHTLNNIDMYIFDMLYGHDCKTHGHMICPFDVKYYYPHTSSNKVLFDLNNMYNCDVIYYPNNEVHILTKTSKNVLVSKIIKVLSKKINTNDGEYENNHLFY